MKIIRISKIYCYKFYNLDGLSRNIIVPQILIYYIFLKQILNLIFCPKVVELSSQKS